MLSGQTSESCEMSDNAEEQGGAEERGDERSRQKATLPVSVGRTVASALSAVYSQLSLTSLNPNPFRRVSTNGFK